MSEDAKYILSLLDDEGIPDGKTPISKIDSIEFKEVWYRLSPTAEWSLQDFSLTLCKQPIVIDLKCPQALV